MDPLYTRSNDAVGAFHEHPIRGRANNFQGRNMIEGDASAGGYTHIFPDWWTLRCYVWVNTCTGRLLVNARVLQSPEDGRWLRCGREERRKKGKREYAARRVLKRRPVCVGRTAPPFAIPTPLGPSLNTLLHTTFFRLSPSSSIFLHRNSSLLVSLRTTT